MDGMNEETLEYVEDRIAAGYDKDIILTELVQKGYRHEEAERLYETAKERYLDAQVQDTTERGQDLSPRSVVKLMFSKPVLQILVFGYVGLSVVVRIITLQIDGFVLILLPLMGVAFVRIGKDAAFYVALFYILLSILFNIPLIMLAAAG